MNTPSTADSIPALAQCVSLQFAGRPTLEQVARRMLEQALKKTDPWLDIDLSKTQLATPDGTARGWQFRPLMSVVLDYLASGTPPDFSPKGTLDCFLSDDPPRRLWSGEQRLDMEVIRRAILELPWSVPIGLEDALVRYWSDDISSVGKADTSDPTSRWRWLSDVLRNTLNLRGLQQPGLTDTAREALDQIVRWPDREQRLCLNRQTPVYAYHLETRLTTGSDQTVLLASEVLLTRAYQGTGEFLLCSPGSAVQSFASLEAFEHHWGARIASQYTVDTITCQRYEISGNVFESQAAMLLEQQLADLQAVQLPAGIDTQDLKHLYHDLSDPARSLLDTPRLSPDMKARLEPLLPAWLKNAAIDDQTSFQQYSLALASAKRRHQGQTFLGDIDDIRAFTIHALLERLKKANDRSPDPLPASQLQPDDVVLTFSVSAGYPGTIGLSEKRQMSLTELAIHNLVGRPSGTFSLSHRLGHALPTWLTPAFVTQLIEQVDIGATYPRYLRQHLLDDSLRAKERQRIFAEQLPAQLMLEALKQKLARENGMTAQGLRLLAAVLQPDTASQRANGRPVVIRHLAVLRKAQAQPDTVANMFVIEAQDIATGPHLLYRPFYAPSLREFPTREALMQAIAAPGALQDSILTWLPDAARPIYANGGFLEPHIVRFFSGDEFSVPDKPAPATLALNDAHGELLQSLHHGELMQYLYGCNAQALVTQADRDSVSNRESRWAVLLEGGGLLFNTLLFPLLRGPAMTTVWLWNLMASAQQDIPALISADPVAREFAAVDLLVNLALLVSQLPAGHGPVARAALPESVQKEAMRSPAPRAIAEQWPETAAPTFVEGTVAVPDAHAEAASRRLDFSFARASGQPTPQQQALLQRLRVPSPKTLPDPIENGPFKGLYVIDSKWHAQVEGAFYRVTPEYDGSATIVDPLAALDADRNGPPLRVDAQGHWHLDLRLRLLGGSPPKRVEAQRRINLERAKQLMDESKRLEAQDADRQKALDVAQQVMTRTEEGAQYTEAQRAAKRQIFYDLLNEQTEMYLTLANSAAERASLGVSFPSGYMHVLMENVINNARKAFLITEKERAAIQRAHPQFRERANMSEIIARDYEGYMKYLDAKSDINDRAIHWLELKDNYLERLSNLDASGARAFERLTRNRPLDEKNAIGSKTLQLSTLPVLAVRNLHSALPERLLRILMPLMEHMRSHCALRIFDLSPPEKLEVLTSLTEHYGKILDTLEGTKALYLDDINESYFDRLVKMIEGLYQEVSRELAAEIKPEPKPRKRMPKRPRTGTGLPQKKLIKTRHNGTLIGDLKPAGTSLPIEVVEMRSEGDNQILATYSRHEDVWDVVDVRRPTSVPQTRSIKAIRANGRELLDDLDKRMSRAESYKTHCRHPQEIEEILNNEASHFRTLSEELDRALTASPASRTPANEELGRQLAGAANQLATKGSDLRIELSLKLPPTDGNLRFLFEKNLIQVARLGDRTALQGARKDFLQEYAINDRDGFPIWYAHFHYAAADTPKDNFSVAHLKTKEQRKEHYHSLLAKATSPYAVVNVHRGQISKSLAQSRFLPLAP
ncbi:dermonecrotic toxin domain-containing protein [Pseudomonas sp. SMV71]|uniref:dermonecrotic toxin domain-containing protein n=1 Tax=Pseudomonas sp. SMV71 TaxID=3390195 RepID=UPI003F84480B